MVEFLRVRHPDVAVEAVLPDTALPYMPGWVPVDADAPKPPALNDGKVDEVLSNVGNDPAKAALALEAEQASPSPRATLVERLSKIKES